MRPILLGYEFLGGTFGIALNQLAVVICSYRDLDMCVKNVFFLELKSANKTGRNSEKSVIEKLYLES